MNRSRCLRITLWMAVLLIILNVLATVAGVYERPGLSQFTAGASRALTRDRLRHHMRGGGAVYQLM